ncbi:MAG: hypothetical protein IT163_03335 [Bryobacterales bacterium]|nr:hypothetical protein [Bryobacterales bacterium]
MSLPLYREGALETLRGELAGAPSSAGGAAGIVSLAALLAVLGVYFPWRLGFDFMDPFLQAVYAGSAPLFQSRMTLAAFSEDKNRRMLEGWWEPPCPQPGFLMGKIAATAIAGYGGALVLYALSLATLTLAHGNGRLLIPGAAFLIPLLLSGAAFSLFTAHAGALLALRVQTPFEARRSIRMAFAALLAVLLLLGPYAPNPVKGAVSSLFLPETFPWAAVVFSAACLALSGVLWRWCLHRIATARLNAAPLTIS